MKSFYCDNGAISATVGQFRPPLAEIAPYEYTTCIK